MKVKLITKTQNLLDVLYTGATTCYNSGGPIDKWFDVCTIPTDKKQKLIDKCIKSGHTSVLEHSQFTFAVEGVSRALLAQLTRHRVGVSFSVQSQRYVEIKEDQDKLYELFTSNNYTRENYKDSELYRVLDKYFTENEFKNVNGYYYALDNYLEAINNGEKAEDARRFLPNAIKTNLVITLNLRSFIHLCHERLCTHAQKEIRQLVREMCNVILKDEEWLKPYLQPKCVAMDKCNESKSCGYIESVKGQVNVNR